jgi:hypothetical protein
VLTGVLMTMLVMGAAPALADIEFQDWRFDSDSPGSFPAGFIRTGNSQAGQWEVRAEANSSSPPNVLARVGSDHAGNEAQVIFIQGAEAGNLDLTARIKAMSARNGEGGGIVFRAQDERNYYVVWLSVMENLVRLDRVVDGKQIPLQELKVDNAEAGKWHNVRLSIRGAVLEAFYDNRQFLSAREDAWQHGSYKTGKVGLWARGSAVTHFDNVRFTRMDGGTGSAPLGGTETTIIK